MGTRSESFEYLFTTIDHFIDENNITKIDAIKFDVDSYDFEVLQGAINTIKRFDPYIIIEINNEALSKRGFSEIDVFKWLYSEAEYRTTCIFDEENYLSKQNLNINDNSYPNVWSL